MYKILLSALLTASNSNSQLIGGKILGPSSFKMRFNCKLQK